MGLTALPVGSGSIIIQPDWVTPLPCRLRGALLLLKIGTVGLGLLTIDGHRWVEANLQTLNPAWRLGVFLNGRERTSDLTAADDRRGWVCGMLKSPYRDGKWAHYLDDNGNVARFVRKGAVEFRLVKADA